MILYDSIFCILPDFLLEDLKSSESRQSGVPLSGFRKTLPFPKTENLVLQSICIKLRMKKKNTSLKFVSFYVT